MCRDFPVTSHFPSVSPRACLLAAKCTCRQDVGSTGHKLKSQKCVRLGGKCLLPTRTWELETSYTL